MYKKTLIFELSFFLRIFRFIITIKLPIYANTGFDSFLQIDLSCDYLITED